MLRNKYLKKLLRGNKTKSEKDKEKMKKRDNTRREIKNE